MNGRQKAKIVKRSLAVLFLFVVPIVSGQTRSQPLQPEPAKDHPLLEIDIRKYGYKPYGSGAMDSLSLAFTQRNEILVAWPTLDDSHSKSQMWLTRPVPSHLHAFILNSTTGQKEHSGEWPSRYLHATIIPVGKEDFLVCTVDEVRLVSHDFVSVQSQILSPPTTCGGMKVSPSGHSFSTLTGPDNSLVDAESFKPIDTWSSNEAVDVRFTDTLLVGLCKPDLDVCIREVSQHWRPFSAAGIQLHLQAFRNQGPFPINDSTLAITNGGEMTVTTLKGAPLFKASLPKKFSFARIATSTGGKRFACVETELRGSAALDMDFVADYRVVVYDLGQSTAVYVRKVRGGSPWIPPFEEHRNRIALSPDGTLLAILDDGVVDVYQLPVPTS